MPYIGNHLNTDAYSLSHVTRNHSEAGDNRRLIMWRLTVVLQVLCTRQTYLHVNAYCRFLNNIKGDCKCQLLGCTGEQKEKRKKNSMRKSGMEMRELFSNSADEINKVGNGSVYCAGYICHFYWVCLYNHRWICLQCGESQLLGIPRVVEGIYLHCALTLTKLLIYQRILLSVVAWSQSDL